jgi:porphobilinogen deaminase
MVRSGADECAKLRFAMIAVVYSEFGKSQVAKVVCVRVRAKEKMKDRRTRTRTRRERNVLRTVDAVASGCRVTVGMASRAQSLSVMMPVAACDVRPVTGA